MDSNLAFFMKLFQKGDACNELSNFYASNDTACAESPLMRNMNELVGMTMRLQILQST